MRRMIPTGSVRLLIVCLIMVFPCGCGDRDSRLYHRGLKYAQQEKFDRAILEMKRLLQSNPDSLRAHNALGQIYRAQNLFSLALEELEKALELDKSDPLPAYNLGSLYLEMEDYSQALKFYEEAVRRDQLYSPALYRLGVVFTALNQIDRAKSYYQEFLQTSPEHPEFGHNNLGVLFWNSGDKARALEEFEEAYRLNSNSPPILFNLGAGSLQLGEKSPLAIKALKRYLKLQPPTVIPSSLKKLLHQGGIIALDETEMLTKEEYWERGSQYEATGEYDRAAAQYQKALKLDPKYLPAHYRLGLLYDSHLEDKLKAISHYEKFLDYNYDPRSPLAAEVISLLGKVRSQLGKRVLARGDLPASPTPVALFSPSLVSPSPPPPAGAETSYQQGQKLEAEERWSEALQSYLKAISLDFEYAPAHFRAGLIYFREGKYQKARAAFKQAQLLDASPAVKEELANTFMKLGESALAENKVDQALEYYREARRYRDDAAVASELWKCHQSRYRGYYREGDFPAAAAELQACVEIKPDAALSYLSLGDIYAEKLGHFSKALPYYRKFLQLAPSHEEASRVKNLIRPPAAEKKTARLRDSAEEHYRRGALYHRAGELEAAQKEYQLALAGKPDFFQVHYNLGVLYSQSGKFSQALESHKQAAAFQPDFAPVHLALFKLYYYHFKMRNLARTSAQRYIELEPESEPAQQLKRWLRE